MRRKHKQAVVEKNPSTLGDLGDVVMCNKDLVNRILAEMCLLCWQGADELSTPTAPGNDVSVAEAWAFTSHLRAEFGEFILQVTRFRKVNRCAAMEAQQFLKNWTTAELANRLIKKNHVLQEAHSMESQLETNEWDVPLVHKSPLAASAVTGFCPMVEEVVYYNTISCAFPKNSIISTRSNVQQLSCGLVPAEPQTFFAMMKGLCMCCASQPGLAHKKRLCRRCQFIPREVGFHPPETYYYNEAMFMHPYNLHFDAYEQSGTNVSPWFMAMPFTNESHMVTIRIHSWKTTPHELWRGGHPGLDLVPMVYKKTGLWIGVPSLEQMQDKDNNHVNAQVRVFGCQISLLGQRRNLAETQAQHILRCLATVHNYEYFLSIKRLFCARILSESIAIGKYHAKREASIDRRNVYFYKKGEYEAEQLLKAFRSVYFAVPLFPLEHIAQYVYLPYTEHMDDKGNVDSLTTAKKAKVDIVTDGSLESIFLGKVTPGSSLDHGFLLTDLIECGKLLSLKHKKALAEEAEAFREEELERRTRLLLWFDHSRWKTTFTASKSEKHFEGLHDIIKCWTFGCQTPNPGDVMTDKCPTNKERVEMLLRLKHIRNVYDFERATPEQKTIMTSGSMVPYLNANAEEQVKTMARALLILRPFGYPDNIPRWLQDDRYGIRASLLYFVRLHLTKTHEMYTRVDAQRVFNDTPAYVPDSDLSGMQVLKVDSPDAHISTWLQVLIHRAPPNKSTPWPLQLHIDRVYCPYGRTAFTRDKKVSRYCTRVLFKLQSGESHVLYGTLTVPALHQLFMTEARVMKEMKSAREMFKEYDDLHALHPNVLTQNTNIEQWLNTSRRACGALNTWLSLDNEQLREKQRPLAFFQNLLLEGWHSPGEGSNIGLVDIARRHDVTLRRYNSKNPLPPGARVVLSTRRQKKHMHYDPPRKPVLTSDHKIQNFCENRGYEQCVCSKKCTFSGDRPKQCVFGSSAEVKCRQTTLNTFLSSE